MKYVSVLLALLLILQPNYAKAADISTSIDNIVAYWSLDEASGTRADSSAGGYTLTDNNSTGAGTGCGYGTNADFTPNDNLSRAAESVWGKTNANNKSVSVWFKPDTVTGVQGIVGYYNGDASGHEWLLYTNGTSLVVLERESGAALTYSSALSIGTCYHVVVTMTSDDIINLYVNNAAPQSVDLASAGTGVNNKVFRIGAYGDTATGYFNGTINDVLITSDILTSGEVSTLYNSGAGIAYSGGGGGGSPAQDQNIIIFE